MRVCLVLSEAFAWGKYGGFGNMARRLAGALREQGVDVCAVVPRRSGQARRECLDGVDIYGYGGLSVMTTDAYATCDADIYHSQEATLATYAAMRAMPDRRHVVTCIDPFDRSDWMTELHHDLRENLWRGLAYPLMWVFYGSWWVHRAVRRADQVYAQARFLIPKARHLYRLETDPVFLPNAYPIPAGPIAKAQHPTVCFLARWDPRKRPEIFFDLARAFPRVRFLAVGKAHSQARDRRLRARYRAIPNLDMVGFIDPFRSDRLSRILSESWIMVNTAAREGLPAAFVEAAAHRCAILSGLDPDGFTSRGGYFAEQGDFEEGLAYLLENDRWRELGELGYAYVQKVHDADLVAQQHLREYRRVLSGGRRPSA